MKWNGKLSLALAMAATLFSAVAPHTARAQEKKPNVVFILADTVGSRRGFSTTDHCRGRCRGSDISISEAALVMGWSMPWRRRKCRSI